MDEQARRRVEQELCELYFSGGHGIACAPMPGTLLEMLEIAATERRAGRFSASPRESGTAEPLTATPHGSPISAWLTRMGRALGHVADRVTADRLPRRMPV